MSLFDAVLRTIMEAQLQLKAARTREPKITIELGRADWVMFKHSALKEAMPGSVTQWGQGEIILHGAFVRVREKPEAGCKWGFCPDRSLGLTCRGPCKEPSPAAKESR